MVRYVPPSSDKVVAVNVQGEIAGYADVADKENGIVTELGGAVHPQYLGKDPGHLLIEWAEERAHNLSNGAPREANIGVCAAGALPHVTVSSCQELLLA